MEENVDRREERIITAVVRGTRIAFVIAASLFSLSAYGFLSSVKSRVRLVCESENDEDEVQKRNVTPRSFEIHATRYSSRFVFAFSVVESAAYDF